MSSQVFHFHFFNRNQKILSVNEQRATNIITIDHRLTMCEIWLAACSSKRKMFHSKYKGVETNYPLINHKRQLTYTYGYAPIYKN